ncbi:MAG: response regulator [Deltaproteobacteria bacterium]
MSSQPETIVTGRSLKGQPVSRGVLVVDDEETVGIGISEILEDAGFNAGYVTSGKEALSAIMSGRYSMVLMDMVMPGMNGLDTFREIKKTSPEIKVILFTGYFKDADKVIFEGVREGMIELFIRKPFFADEIVEAAKKYA